VAALLGESAAPISSVPLIHEVGTCHALSAGIAPGCWPAKRRGALAGKAGRRRCAKELSPADLTKLLALRSNAPLAMAGSRAVHSSALGRGTATRFARLGSSAGERRPPASAFALHGDGGRIPALDPRVARPGAGRRSPAASRRCPPHRVGRRGRTPAGRPRLSRSAPGLRRSEVCAGAPRGPGPGSY
jgi:hypothetical protein